MMNERMETGLSSEDLYHHKMIVKQGIRHVLLDIKNIVYCYSSNKVVFVVDAEGHKYIADKNLLHLESDFNPRVFFKANRTHIINFNFIRSFATHERNKILVELRMPEKDLDVVISQTRVNAFRTWIRQQL